MADPMQHAALGIEPKSPPPGNLVALLGGPFVATDSRKAAAHDDDPVAGLARELDRFGLALSGPPVIDGTIQRVAAVDAKKAGDDAGWYVAAHLGDAMVFASFGNWRTGAKASWSSRDVAALPYGERTQLDQLRAKLDAERDAELRRRQTEARARASSIWNEAGAAPPDHPYLARKGINPEGLKVSRGKVVVPIRNAAGELVGLQFIGGDGSKRYLAGTAKAGAYHVIGVVRDRLYAAEGLATASTVAKATGHAVAVLFDAGNLAPGIAALRERHSCPIIIAADNDRWTDGNPGATKAREAAGLYAGVTIAVPEFASIETKPTDFNDLEALEGLEAVRRQLRDPGPPPTGVAPSPFRPLDMSVLGSERRAPAPFPVEVFGRQWSAFIEAEADMAGAPVDYVAMGILAAAATLIGNARVIEAWHGWREPSVLWCMIVGDPSAGKTPALGLARDLVAPIDTSLAQAFGATLADYSEKASTAKAIHSNWEKTVQASLKSGQPIPPMPHTAIEPEKPTCPSVMVTDVTPERLGSLLLANPKGLLLFRDELAGWLGDMGRYGGDGERQLWLEAYNAGFRKIDRVKLDKPIIVPRFAVSILGGIQPERFTDAIGSGVDDGLSARFLLAWPDAVSPKRPTSRSRPAWPAAAFRRLFDLRLAKTSGPDFEPVAIALAGEAIDRFQAWRIGHHEDSANVEGLAKGAWGKMPGQLLRLALVLELLWWSHREGDSEPTCIGLGAVEAAIQLIDGYFKPMARRVLGDAALPADLHAAAMLARWLLRHMPDAFNARALRNGRGCPALLRNARMMHSACEALVDAGWIAPEQSPTEPRTGRKSSGYRVNSALKQPPACALG